MVTCVPGNRRLHGLGQHVGAVVADQFQRARILAGDELDAAPFVHRVGKVGQFAVQGHGHGAFGEGRGDALGDVEAGYARLELALRAVRETSRKS